MSSENYDTALLRQNLRKVQLKHKTLTLDHGIVAEAFLLTFDQKEGVTKWAFRDPDGYQATIEDLFHILQQERKGAKDGNP